MVWVDCPKCSAKDTCVWFQWWVKNEENKEPKCVCIKGCK